MAGSYLSVVPYHPRAVGPCRRSHRPAVRAAASPGERHVRQPFHTLNRFFLAAGRSGRFHSLPAWPTPAFRACACRCRCASCSNLLRNLDGRRITEADVRRLASWPRRRTHRRDPFVVARVVLQDFTGVPLLADLAAMRDVARRLGKNPRWSSRWCRWTWWWTTRCRWITSSEGDALDLNMKLDRRNAERYRFMKWGMQAFDTFRVVPPGFGIVHQVNLEYLARGVIHDDDCTTPTPWWAPTATPP
jgi:aconitate hydratase